MANESCNIAAGDSAAIMAMQARSLICILEDLMEAGDVCADDRNEPHSPTQKRWACLRSLRMHVDALADTAVVAAARAPALTVAEPAPKSRDRGYFTRQALSNLMMATMEMHTYSGTTDAAFELTEKALAAIGTLRIMTNGGRVQP